MKINREKCLEIEEAFSKLKTNENDVSPLLTISGVLKELTGKTFNITVYKPNSTRDECSIMTVYPDEKTMDNIISSVVNTQSDPQILSIWNRTLLWNVEIDARVLYSAMNFTPQELTALLLHEVGHTVYSNSVPVRIATVIKLTYVKSDVVTRNLFKNNFLSKILCFPIIYACNSDKSKASLRTELAADRYAVAAGYGDALRSAIDKVIIYAGTDTNINDDIEELMGFSIDTITALQKRQTILARQNLGMMMKNVASPFCKKYISKITTAFSGNPNSSMTESVFNRRLSDQIDKIVKESTDKDALYCEGVFNRVHKLKRIDPMDIDYIALQIEDIKSNDDKVMIVSYIYNKIDIIDYYISLIDSKSPRYIVPHSKESLLSMREKLNQYRLAAMNKKLIPVQYGLVIQYPEGYEG